MTATLISVPGGAERGRAGPVTGPADSLDALLRRAATSLLAAVGGQARPDDRVRFTESPAAMRAYLEGLAAWRRGRLADAAESFVRAIAEDSGFAQALFRRYLAGDWGVPGGAPYTRLTWERRARLSPQERTVLEAVLGSQYPRIRLVEDRLADRQRAVNLLPDSPDALYFLGDWYYHWAAPVDPVNQLRLAKEYLERSAAVDSQATVLRHLIEIGVRTQDSALLRHVWPAYERTEDVGKWGGLWLVAASMGDQALLAALRRRPVDPGPYLFARWGLFSATTANIPARLLDEMYERWSTAAGHQDAPAPVAVVWGGSLAMRGRPAAAERVWSGLEPEPAVQADALRVELARAGEGTGLDAASSVERLAAVRTGDSTTVATSACLVALWRVQHGDTAAVDPERFRQPARRCSWAIELSRAA
ncbi:MAG: hypothetical protein Q8S13_09480, partial [Dehalococcoidia bacterium]|nr:hypothetical protein [Dehalococcoidia bacterium]